MISASQIISLWKRTKKPNAEAAGFSPHIVPSERFAKNPLWFSVLLYGQFMPLSYAPKAVVAQLPCAAGLLELQ